jgi:hypothetical protein
MVKLLSWQILAPFFENLSDEEREYDFFKQDDATSRTANKSVSG